MNDLDLCIEVVKVMSTIASHSSLDIFETVEIGTWFQRITNRKWPM